MFCLRPSWWCADDATSAVAAREMPYCEGFGGRAILHSQAGIDTDIGITAGSRVPVGQEPDLYRHLRAVAPHHVLFPSGVSDIVHLDEMVAGNPQAAVDIAKGAFSLGMRDVETDASGRELRVLAETPARSGANVVLSIDVELQRKATEFVQAGMGASKNAAAVVIDVRNGELLALVW